MSGFIQSLKKRLIAVGVILAVLAAAGGQVKTPEGQDVAYGKAEAGFRNGWFVAKG